MEGRAPKSEREILPPEQRRDALQQALAEEIQSGWRVESQGDYQAVIIKGARVNHLLHLILSIITAGLWIVIWIIVTAFGGETRQALTVDEFGDIYIGYI